MIFTILIGILIYFFIIDFINYPNYNDEWGFSYIVFKIYNWETDALELNLINYYRNKGIYIIRNYKSSKDNQYTKDCYMHLSGPKNVIKHIESQIEFAYAI